MRSGKSSVSWVDGFAFHRHRAVFERDRARDAALQAAGYRVVRFTHRRLEREPGTVAGELRSLLSGKLR
jgi:very-short-patch-repair endonuclease